MKYPYLADKHWNKQDYLLYAYDVLGDMLRQADSQKLSNVTMKFTDERHISLFQEAEDKFLWMEQHGYHDISVKMFCNHMFFSLLRDFCYYIFESLSCAERRKITVAYTLLRKPMKDNLLYLEWLLASPEEFYSTFLYNNIESYDISSKKNFPPERIQDIVDNACGKTYMGKLINYNNLIFDFRFNRKEIYGLQRIWDQTIHLVTATRDYKTKAGNLNFVFADNKIWDEFTDYYYFVMPQLMTYVLGICESLFITKKDVDEVDLLLNRTVRFVKYANIQPDIEPINQLKNNLDLLIQVFESESIVPCFTCESCNDKIKIDADILNEIIQNWFIICPNCKQEHNICKYYTDCIKSD